MFKAFLSSRFLTFADQISSSAGNFLLLIVIGRYFGVHELAAYGLALTWVMNLKAVHRSAFQVPLSLVAPQRFQTLLKGIIAQHLLILMGMAIITALGFFIYGLWQRTSLFELTFLSMMPCFLLIMSIDVERIISIKCRTYALMTVLNALYAPVIVLCAILAHQGWITYTGFCVLISAYAVLRSVCVLGSHGLPNIKWGWLLLLQDGRNHMWQMGWSASISVLLLSMPILLLGYTAPEVHTAAFVATRSLIQPLDVLFRGLDVVDKHRFSVLSIHDHAGLRRTFLKTSSLYLIIAVSFTSVMGFFSPQLLHLAFKGAFDAYVMSVWLWCGVFMLTALLPPLESLIFKMGHSTHYGHIQIAAGVFSLILAFLLVPFNTPFSYENGAILTRLLTWVVLLVACYLLILKPLFHKRVE
jgi:O-antigen/teichoic acid export membrane protein